LADTTIDEEVVMKSVRKLLLVVALIAIVLVNQRQLNAYTWDHELPESCDEQEQLCESYCGPDPIIFGCGEHPWHGDSSGWCDCDTPPYECGEPFEYCDGMNPCCPGNECHFDIHECIPEI
jgi:hypothetical protein